MGRNSRGLSSVATEILRSRAMKKKKTEVAILGVEGPHFRFFCWRIKFCPFCLMPSIERIKK